MVQTTVMGHTSLKLSGNMKTGNIKTGDTPLALTLIHQNVKVETMMEDVNIINLFIHSDLALF